MAWVNEGSQFYLPPTHLSTSRMNHTCLYFPSVERHRTLADTHFPFRWGKKAELAWVAGYKPRGFSRPQTVSRPSTNRARRRATSLIETNALPLSEVKRFSQDDSLNMVRSFTPNFIFLWAKNPRNRPLTNLYTSVYPSSNDAGIKRWWKQCPAKVRLTVCIRPPSINLSHFFSVKTVEQTWSG